MERKRVLVGVSGASGAPLAVELLRTFAGHRRSQTYVMPSPGASSVYTGSAVPVEVDAGGVTIFTMKLEGFQKF